jgi:hypothetical protein
LCYNVAMKTSKANSRDKKYQKSRYGMRVSGRSIFQIQETIIKRADKARKQKKES